MAARVIPFSEAHMIDGCRRQDRNCQRQLYESYFQTMSWLCLRYLKDPDLVEDIVHEGFLKVFQRIDSFEGKGSLEGWVKRIMVNCCLDHLRKTKRMPTQVELDQIAEPDPGLSPQSSMEADQIMDVVNSLSPLLRVVFQMNVVEGYPHKDIAEQLGIQESTSRAYLTEAKKKLRTTLSRLGWEQEKRMGHV
jgi:RNA polymerase sigma factor (sigma-70 family)